jgi:hypothetical protein
MEDCRFRMQRSSSGLWLWRVSSDDRCEPRTNRERAGQAEARRLSRDRGRPLLRAGAAFAVLYVADEPRRPQ